jgi:hypothetical protein
VAGARYKVVKRQQGADKALLATTLTAHGRIGLVELRLEQPPLSPIAPCRDMHAGAVQRNLQRYRSHRSVVAAARDWSGATTRTL